MTRSESQPSSAPRSWTGRLLDRWMEWIEKPLRPIEERSLKEKDRLLGAIFFRLGGGLILRYTTADMWSVSRFILVWPIMMLIDRGRYQLAWPLLLFAELTDVVDGLIARFTGTTSERGMLIESSADFVLRLGVFWAIIDQFGNAQLLWAAVTLEVARMIGTIILMIQRKKLVTNMSGRVKSVAYCLFGLSFLWQLPIWCQYALLTTGVWLSFFSLTRHLVEAARQFPSRR